MIATLLDRLARFEEVLQRGKSVNVNSAAAKEKAVELGQFYFAECRPALVSVSGEDESLLEYDKQWQHLIRLAQGNNSRATYRTVVRRLRKGAAELRVKSLTQVQPPPTVNAFSRTEQMLIETLALYVPSAAASYEQGIRDLANVGERVSYRGSATEFREALRETLDHLAPDADVMAEPGFKLEEKRTGPTMKQKVRFILVSRGIGKTKRAATEKSADVVETLCGEVARAVYDRASLSTHVATTRGEVLQIKRYVDTVLCDLLEISDR